MLIRIWQVLLCSLLVIALAYTFHIKGHFQLATAITDVAPKIAPSAQAKHAISALSKDIERRIVFLISGKDQDAVLNAADDLRSRLQNNPRLQLLPSNDELFETLAQGLAPYRFHLLSTEQANHIRSSSERELAQAAKTDVFSAASARIYPFSEDPFGVASASLLDAIEQLHVPQLSDSQSYQSISLRLKDDKLGINEQVALNQELNQYISDVTSTHSVSVDRSGVFFFAVHAAKESKKDIGFISAVSTFGVVVLLLFVFRSFAALLLPIMSIAVGVAFAFIVTHYVYTNVHVLTILFGASLIGIVVDYSLHYFYHSMNSNNAEHKALHRALLLSLCTSLIGYAALSFSGLEALKKVALFSCSGLFMAWLCVVCCGRPLMAKNNLSEPRVLKSVVSGLSMLTSELNARVKLIAIMLIFSAAGISWFVVKPISDDPRVFFTAPAALLESEQRVAAVSSDFEPGQYLVFTGSSPTAVLDTYYASLERLSEQDSQLIGEIVSVLGLFPNKQQQQINYELQAKLYGAQGAINDLAAAVNMEQPAVQSLQAQYHQAVDKHLALQDIQSLLGDALPPMWFENSDSYLGFALIKKGVNADVLEQVLADINGAEYVNTLKKTQQALSQQRQSAVQLLCLAYGLIAALILLRYRKLDSLAMLAVPLTASAGVIALAAICSYQLNLFHFMALFLVLGFGMDYTIFVREMKAHKSKTMQAILLSALTSLLSFGLLSVSSVPVAASFGMTLLIGNSINLFGAFLYSSWLCSNEYEQSYLNEG